MWLEGFRKSSKEMVLQASEIDKTELKGNWIEHNNLKEYQKPTELFNKKTTRLDKITDVNFLRYTTVFIKLSTPTHNI